MTLGISDLVGIAGAVVIVVAYLLLQLRRLDARSVSFSLANAVGASGIIFSLLSDFNLSAFVIEVFWLVLSLYGVYRAIEGSRPTSGDDAESASR